MKYRPDGWENPHVSKYIQAHPKYTSSTPEVLAYEDGADAMLKALREKGEDVYTPHGTGKLVIIPDDKE